MAHRLSSSRNVFDLPAQPVKNKQLHIKIQLSGLPQQTKRLMNSGPVPMGSWWLRVSQGSGE